MDKLNEILKTEKNNELKNEHNSTISKILDNIYELVGNKLIDRLKDKNLLDEEDHENLENNERITKKWIFRRFRTLNKLYGFSKLNMKLKKKRI